MKKIIKLIAIAVCCMLIVPLVVGCAGKSLEYSSNELPTGVVGVEYSESIAGAEADGDAAIVYTLKEGSSLPLGLTLSTEGEIFGIPAAKSEKATIFTVVASADGYKSTEADFSISRIASGTLKYSAELPRVAINKPYTGTLDVSGAGSEVTYTLVDGEMPTGLTFNNGVITGTPTVLNEEKIFRVTATATDSTSVSSEFTLKVILPWLEYSSFAIEKARQDVDYGETVATASDATEVAISYTLKNGSSLPRGLAMDSSGYISGTPTVAGPAVPFTVVASAAGYSSSEATFRIVVRKPIVVEGAGTIFYSALDLEPGYLNETYHVVSTDIRKGSASNGATVTYKLKEGSSLPSGLILQSGRIRTGSGSNSMLTVLGNHTFIIVAMAEDCEDVEAEFSFTVLPERLIYSNKTLDDAIVGDSYETSIATAQTRDGANVDITYKLKVEGSLPAGLALNGNAQLVGTPTKSAKQIRFIITASAAGYSSVDAHFFIHIKDKITTVNDGLFEAEYIDFTGMKGEGWSGNAFEEGMIQNESANASNGYYIGWTLYRNLFYFNFTSSQAVTGASLKVRLATEFGNMSITPSAFDVIVNGESLPYGTFQLNGTSGAMGAFSDYTVTVNNLKLNAGDNTIVLQIKDNTLLNGSRTFGPGIDCIKVENFGGAVFNWRPCTYNLDRFAA